MALPEHPPPRLWADERLIKQALLNILSNAVKFTPSGGRIRMTAVVEPFSESSESRSPIPGWASRGPNCRGCSSPSIAATAP